MAFSELELKRIEKTVGAFCIARTPQHIKDELSVEYSIKGHDVLIYEKRPCWKNPSEYMEEGVAKLKYTRTTNTWQLFWQRATLKWQSYEPFPQSKDIGELVKVIDADRYGCFFG